MRHHAAAAEARTPGRLAPGLSLSGQAAAIGISHTLGVDPPATPNTQAPTVIKQTQTLAIQSLGDRIGERGQRGENFNPVSKR